MSRLFTEIRWLIQIALALLLLLALLSYDPRDPAWTHAAQVTRVANWGGRVGAYVSDLMLLMFGMSAYWWVLLIARRVASVFRRLNGIAEPPGQHGEGGWLIESFAFVLLLVSSTGIEALRMWSLPVALPRAPGGVLGDVVARAVSMALGFTGGTLLLLFAMAIASSLFFRFSWLSVAERLGDGIISAVTLARLRQEARRDRRLGEAAASERGSVVARSRRGAETMAAPVAPAAVATVPAAGAGARRERAAVEPTLAREPSFDAATDGFDDAYDDAYDDVRDAMPRKGRKAESAAPARPAPAELPRDGADALDPPFDPPYVGEAQANRPEPRFGAVEKLLGKVVRRKDEAGGPRTEPAVGLDDAEAPVRGAAPAARAADRAVDRPADKVERAAERPSRGATESYLTVPVTPQFVDHGDGSLPSLSLLDPAPTVQEVVSSETIEFTKRLIEKKLKDFGVEVAVMDAFAGPVVTRYEIEPATGVKGSQIVNLAKDLARSLSLVSIRVVETIPGKNLMGLELPNSRRQTVRLSEVIGADVYNRAGSPLTMALGKDISGNPVCADLAKMPHLLVAGTTGSGKSVGINAMILSLLYKARADEVRMILIDPKMLEMSVYEGIPHLLCPVVTDMRQAGNALNWTVAEMERRYKLMSKLGVRNLAGYNTKIDDAAKRGEKIPNPFSLTPDAPEPIDRLPSIVVVIDELADLMMVVGKKVEELIARIAQKARAAGIHLILATQRPSVDVITGLIKANVPTRIAFQVSSKIDSRTILDQQGADTLLGMGDMLYLPPGTGLPVRVHGAFVSDDEVHRVVERLKEQGEPNYIEGLLEGGVAEGEEGGGAGGGEGGDESDPLYDQAVEVVVKNRRASISLVQRHLRIGYNRAARLLEQMENSGLVSPMSSNGNREILVPNRDIE
ncbi:DNA translocase FtsK [Chitinasiproducens palmae]|uniref:DNA segregation ATPase FtsK/SpoIIIE n=1 Tax=Chitinasiproducens palmae TaxID=1770053 RepID=A0A1H2PN12_9BURK|nr:DNA segregation ATPase FtsK/SpoIIIE [Chitinasiproducens palmae]